MSFHFDVAIVGSGPAGSVAALVLARLGHKVILVDKPSRQRTQKVGESLPGAARRLLQHLDCADLLEQKHLLSYGNCSAWGSSELITVDGIYDPSGLGWHLDRLQFDQDLRDKAVSAGVCFVEEAVEHVTTTESGCLLNRATAVRWLIDCSGRSAQIARKLGATRFKDDGTMAVYTWVPADDVDSRTIIEATKEGWWYSSLLPTRQRIISFHTNVEKSGELVRSGKEMWKALLEQTNHLRNFGAISPRELFCAEACGARLDRFAGEKWIAAGDAALSFDPLSSQGIFNSLYTGMKAGEAVHSALNGSLVNMQRYCEQLEEIRAAYLSRRRYYYSTEQRWINESFWGQRIS